MKKYLPEIKQVWSFIFFVLGALMVYAMVDAPITKLNRSWQANQQELIQKNDFVEELSVLSFKRIYYAENYYANKVSDQNQEIIENSYINYIESVRAWNERNLLNTIFLEKYYGREVRDEYENELLHRLVGLHEAVLETRNDAVPDDFVATLEAAKNQTYKFNEQLYIER